MLYRKGSILFGDLHEQPNKLRQVLATLAQHQESLQNWFKEQNFGQVIYVATSDFYNVAHSLARTTHLVCGLNSVAISASEILYGRRPPYDARIRTLVVVLTNPYLGQELSWGVERLRQLDPRARVLALEVEGSNLAPNLANPSLVFPELKENLKFPAVSVSALFFASLVVISWLGRKENLQAELQRVPDILEAHLKDWQVKSQQLVLDKPNAVVFLGSGPFEGIARQAAFMCDRIAGLPANSNLFVEYRHGYYGCATNQTMIVGLISNTFRHLEERILSDVGVTRARRVALVEDSSTELMTRSDDLLELKSGASEVARTFLLLCVVQFMVFYLAMSRGVNPDNPKHLEHPRMALKERPGTTKKE